MTKQELLGIKFKEAREKKGLSQQEVANLIVGKKANRSNVYLTEKGKSNLTLNMLLKYCEVLELEFHLKDI